MDQGYQQVPRRVASGYFSLIFFIVLCLVLIGGYVPVVLALQQRHQDLKRLNQLLDEKVVQPLQARNQAPRRQQPVEGSTLIYGEEFFTELHRLADDGVEYKDLVRQAGYGTGADALKAIGEKLTTNVTGQAQPTLKDLVADLERTIQGAREALAQTQRALANAQLERERAVSNLNVQRDAMEAKIKELEALLDKTKADGIRQRDEVARLLNETHEDLKKMTAERNKALEEKKAAMDELGATVAAQKKEIERLRIALQGQQPEAKEGPLATVQQVDSVHDFVVLDRGERDGVTLGARLGVFRPARQGQVLFVGQVVVVKVDERVSRADIVRQDPLTPIIRGDTVYVHAPENVLVPETLKGAL